MQFLKELWLRLVWLFRQARFGAEFDDEMRFHIESRAEELERGGMSRSDAMAAARKEFGSRLKAAEDTRDVWHWQWVEDLFSDLHYAGRAFRRNPGFAIAAIACLALGIGANTTIFSISTSLLFSQPSARDSERLISIWPAGSSAASVEDYKFLQQAKIFDGTAGIDIEREANWRSGERTSRLFAGGVTDDFFPTVGTSFLLGRGFGGNERDAVVISERVWRGAYHSDPAILGQKMILDGKVYNVVGVLPANHRSIVGMGISPDVYVPVENEDESVQFYARMPQGMTIGAARARIHVVLEELDQVKPKDGYKRARQQTPVTGVTGMDVLNLEIPGAVTAFFAMLMVVVGLVLLIACTNVTSLLLARAASRSHELAIRLSIGASRQRIIRHLLAESLLLSVVGAGLGVAIDLVLGRWMGRIDLPVPAPLHLIIEPEWRLLTYSLCLVILSALLCGLLPALKATGGDVTIALKQEEHQTMRVWSLRSLLVAGQLAVSVVLLATAFLFVHNLLRATTLNPGFDLQHTIWAKMRLVPDRYRDADQTKQMTLARVALEKLRSLPGVNAASISARVPLNGNCVTGTSMRTDLSPKPTSLEFFCNNVGPDYFRTLQIPVMRGREFRETDSKGSVPAVVVNESFARTVFGNVNPVGHTIIDGFPKETSRMIVGVVKDSKYFTLSEKQQMAIYEPYFGRTEENDLNFLIRTTGPPAGYTRPITELLATLDGTAAIEAKPMSNALGLALLPSRVAALVLGAIGVLGLLLAVIGLYGALLYTVSRRTREIGLRVALGASRGNVMRLVGGQSLALVGCGVAIGLVLAFFAVQPLAMFLVPGVKALDPAAFLAVLGLLSLVAVLAVLVPARKALAVDPMMALRWE